MTLEPSYRVSWNIAAKVKKKAAADKSEEGGHHDTVEA